MDNGYDSVFRNIPVSFYESDPASGGAQKIDATYYTPTRLPGSCAEYSTVVTTPRSGEIFAAVNDEGGGSFPDISYPETVTDNNVSGRAVERFEVSLSPSDTTVNRMTNLRLQASAVSGTIKTFTWTPDDKLSCVNCLDPTLTVPYSQKIVFSARNQYGCTSVDTANIETYSTGPVNIPNAFTPNGDGKNDVFYIMGSRDIEMVKDFAIYDRYGQKVFQIRNVPPNNPVYGWRGIAADGKVMTSASFVYAVTIRFRDGREQLYKGTITVIR
jgi:gliding motility-associated-like protein